MIRKCVVVFAVVSIFIQALEKTKPSVELKAPLLTPTQATQNEISALCAQAPRNNVGQLLLTAQQQQQLVELIFVRTGHEEKEASLQKRKE